MHKLILLLGMLPFVGLELGNHLDALSFRVHLSQHILSSRLSTAVVHNL